MQIIKGARLGALFRFEPVSELSVDYSLAEAATAISAMAIAMGIQPPEEELGSTTVGPGSTTIVDRPPATAEEATQPEIRVAAIRRFISFPLSKQIQDMGDLSPTESMYGGAVKTSVVVTAQRFRPAAGAGRTVCLGSDV
jgi:hypothetical protein